MKRHGIVIDNNWIESYVGAILKWDLSPELFANQMRYLKLDADAEWQIRHGDYPTCAGHLATVEDWENMYNVVGHDVHEIARGNKNVLSKYEIEH